MARQALVPRYAANHLARHALVACYAANHLACHALVACYAANHLACHALVACYAANHLARQALVPRYAANHLARHVAAAFKVYRIHATVLLLAGSHCSRFCAARPVFPFSPASFFTILVSTQIIDTSCQTIPVVNS
ncbi:hypothetical protein DLD77_01550 [Chitinophaga alhagiae]|uniref:Uncharacterized protein n=1 Tax=Chitinophaga alhagiae TaxID=2203219 RepID=A0ABM6W942_9BACT|nr:hypothetical protein DLD77_01550 [Chitinophaga alhagiae]